MVDATPDDVTRRTLLAAERTWLAWWRSGITAAAAAVGVGGVAPQLVDGGRTAYALLGAGYALLAAGVFVGAALRRRRVEAALREGEWSGVGKSPVMAFTLAGVALALGTVAVILTQA